MSEKEEGEGAFMHEGYVYHIQAQVKVSPNKLEETDTQVLAHTMQEAMAQYEAEIFPATVFHYHSVTDKGTCLHL